MAQLDRIKRVSRITHCILLILAFLGPTILLLGWLLPSGRGYLVRMQILPMEVIGINPMILHHPIAAFFLSLIPVLLGVLILLLVAHLFGQFSRGDMFSHSGMHCLRWAGALILVWELFRPFYEVAMTAIVLRGTTHLVHAIEFDISNVRGIMVGIILYVLAWVLAQARQLYEAQLLTI